jgi:hypothetical protein
MDEVINALLKSTLFKEFSRAELSVTSKLLYFNICLVN